MTASRVWTPPWMAFLLLLSLLTACHDSPHDPSRHGDDDATEQTWTENDTDLHEDDRDAEEAVRNEAFRPQTHFSPRNGWMNDPNGLVYFQDEYHLFFQHAPEGFLTSGMHWGHAVSRDLVHWDELPIALYPDAELGNVYSGSAVVDRNNTSGLCQDAESGDDSCLVLLFTHSGGKVGGQKQSLAYSLDKGRSWIPYPQNPVLLPPEGQKDFRDPKVFWHDATSRWIMALAAKDQISFYHSPNLRQWTFLSDFIKDAADETGMWECPDLFKLATAETPPQEKWVMVVSVFSGGPQGGSGVRYFIGNFDGQSFQSETPPATPLWLDAGSDFYAWQSWSEAPEGKRLGIAWMNNWSYALGIKTEPWQGAMTTPRELVLREFPGLGLRVVQQAASGLDTLRGESLLSESNQSVDGETEWLRVGWEKPLEIRLTLDPGQSQTAGIVFSAGSDSRLSLGYDRTSQRLFLERNATKAVKLPDSFAARYETALEPVQDRIILRILKDRSAIEIFSDDGRLAMTEQVFPDSATDTLSLFAHGGIAVFENVDVRALHSIW